MGTYHKDGVCDYPKCHGMETVEWLGKSLCIKHLSWVDDPQLYARLVRKLKLPVETPRFTPAAATDRKDGE